MIRQFAFAIALLAGASAAHADSFTPQQRQQALEHIAALIEKNYVHKDVAATVASQVRGWSSDAALLSAMDRQSFASIVTDRLKATDGHFNLRWTPPSIQTSLVPHPGKGAVKNVL